MTTPNKINFPPPKLQIDFAFALKRFRAVYLQSALLETVRDMDIAELDKQLAEYVPPADLATLAQYGLRAELLFAVPAVLEANPYLLGYYRLLMGYSQKEFYGRDKGFGVGYFKSMEEKGKTSKAAAADLPDLCVAFCATASALLAGVGGSGIAKGKVLNDDKADWREAWALFPGDVAYVWHAGLFAGVVGESLQAAGFRLRSQIVWDKGQLVLSRGDYHWQHEPCWYAVREGKKGHWAGDRKQVTVWQIEKPRKSETGHGTQKPVECMQRPIENNSKPGDAIYEPFSGSGTTIIAAEATGRRCFAVELNPAYVDVAVRRWQEFTGKAATLVASGETFTETEEARRPQEIAAT